MPLADLEGSVTDAQNRGNILAGVSPFAIACLTDCAVGNDLAVIPDGQAKALSIEPPVGEMTVIGHIDEDGAVGRAEVLRTARKLFDGTVLPRGERRAAV